MSAMVDDFEVEYDARKGEWLVIVRTGWALTLIASRVDVLDKYLVRYATNNPELRDRLLDARLWLERPHGDLR